MVHTFSAAFIARSVYNDASWLDDPSEDRDLLQLFFCQRSYLGGYRQANAGNIKVRGVVADIDIGFSRMYIFFSLDLIRNEIEFAESPGPEF